jgi:quercetin dioxygenase-like cupin family protein
MIHRRNIQADCFVVDRDGIGLSRRGALGWAQVIGHGDQAAALSLFYLEAGPGAGPALLAGDGEVVLYLIEGQCTVSICGREFPADAGTGIHVRRGETYSFLNAGTDTACWLACACPRTEGMAFAEQQGCQFEEPHPKRAVSMDRGRMMSTEDRYYQILVGPSVGSESITQFIGKIPPSKAPEHFHLYEEAICILSGHGRMWAGEHSEPVGPGSMIFLPRKQAHCLECLDENGMELVGMFYPAGSPAINYKTGS